LGHERAQNSKFVAFFCREICDPIVTRSDALQADP